MFLSILREARMVSGSARQQSRDIYCALQCWMREKKKTSNPFKNENSGEKKKEKFIFISSYKRFSWQLSMVLYFLSHSLYSSYGKSQHCSNRSPFVIIPMRCPPSIRGSLTNCSAAQNLIEFPIVLSAAVTGDQEACPVRNVLQILYPICTKKKKGHGGWGPPS